jgi:hypothetical protein
MFMWYGGLKTGWVECGGGGSCFNVHFEFLEK